MAFFFISDLWNILNIRGVVILSLLLQVLLILFGSLKKKIADNPITLLLWLAYLMADSIVVYGIGLISRNHGNPSARGAEVNGAIQALWASFLLLHLGGPDTITSSSLEDSSLWKRHFFSLIFQVSTALYVFVHIFPTNESLVIPTMLVFSIGVIKNTERILALYLSSFPRMRKSMHSRDFDMPSVELLSVELDQFGCSHKEAKLPESIVVKHAYELFQIFKVFFGDLIFTRAQRRASREYFCKVSSLDALRVISVELQFMYEMLHTKALAIRSKWSYIFRFVALNVLAVAFILFNRLKKHRLSEVDIKITYSLLCGGIALEVTALFMLVFSDWTAGIIKCRNRTSSRLNSFLDKLVSATDYLRKPRFAACEAEPNCHIYLDTPLIFRRWSESISACNLFSEIMKESPKKMKKCNRGWINIAFYNISSFLFRMAENIASSFGQIRETVVKCCFSRTASTIAHARYVSKNPFNIKLWIFIFAEVKRKSIEIQSYQNESGDYPIELRDMFEARGDLFLKRSKLVKLQEVDFQPYITACNYDSSIFVWHIATEWWYNNEGSTGRNEEREFSKILSDYMLYLLLNQPNVVFAVAGDAQFTSMPIMMQLDLCIYFRGVAEKGLLSLPLSEVVEKLTEMELWGMMAGIKARQGFLLAQEIGRLGERKWEVMSGVWVEMLCYAAGHIRGESHAQVLSKGGELLAFVWLLMAHFGCLVKEPWGPACDPSVY